MFVRLLKKESNSSMSKDSIDIVVGRMFAQPCPYRVPPLQYLNGHAVCPCIGNAVKRAYLEGYADGLHREIPQLGRLINDD